MAIHAIEITEDGVYCTVCKQSWRKTPFWECPGVPVYAWGASPENLKTKAQIDQMRMKLKPDSEPVGCLGSRRHGWIWLYNLESVEERPPLTEKQVAGFEKIRERARQRRTCSVCGVEQESPRHLTRGVCDECALKAMIVESHKDAVEWARKLMVDPSSWVILDTETTGLGVTAEIVQVAVFYPANQSFFQTLVKPTQEIPVDAIAIHGITNEMVQDAPTFPAVYEKLSTLLEGKTVVIYNADFDVRMLEQDCKRHGLETNIRSSAVCAMKWYAKLCGQWNEYFGDLQWLPLPGGDHSALGDCQATLAIIERMTEG